MAEKMYESQDDSTVKGAENRDYLRLGLKISVKFKIMDENYQEALPDVFSAFVRNVGRGGIRIHSGPIKKLSGAEFIPKKTKLKIELSMPGSGPIEAAAQLRWVQKGKDPSKQPFDFGVLYEEIGEQQCDRLTKYAFSLWEKRQVQFSVLLIVISAIAILGAIIGVALFL